ncbi:MULTISPECIES: metallophosphoesterase [Clostridium]|uniref:Calcineurin-like phosphoesterase domain-containing protein n=1 Tax=Clostridium senegalense TaxID=1465809 RepID=A0A6M0H5J6_9CLOT|nr:MULTISPECIES: metallophosphoesterase [Clostridium]NEU05909.1 hypothetical protein [Clostridium senegalense]
MSKDILKKIMISCPKIDINNKSKFVFISDCHRGDGTWKDDLLPNSNIYMAALKYYYKKDFSYVEVGDGDELWKVSKIGTIYEIHPEIFKILLKFKNKDKLYMIVGNHDKIKKSKKFKKEIECYENDVNKRNLYMLFKDLPIYDGIMLIDNNVCKNLFVVHGHQVDFLNYQLSFLSKFLVKYVWGFMEQVFGFKNPTSPAKSKSRRTVIDRKLERWAKENNQSVLAGHTHRSILNNNGCKYFNDGCCVQPYSMSCIELENGLLTLVKWKITSLENGVLCVKRSIISEPINIDCI